MAWAWRFFVSSLGNSYVQPGSETTVLGSHCLQLYVGELPVAGSGSAETELMNREELTMDAYVFYGDI